jgi:hypothetical protein
MSIWNHVPTATAIMENEDRVVRVPNLPRQEATRVTKSGKVSKDKVWRF